MMMNNLLLQIIIKQFKISRIRMATFTHAETTLIVLFTRIVKKNNNLTIVSIPCVFLSKKKKRISWYL